MWKFVVSMLGVDRYPALEAFPVLSFASFFAE
jgi:hypothetical protein